MPGARRGRRQGHECADRPVRSCTALVVGTVEALVLGRRDQTRTGQGPAARKGRGRMRTIGAISNLFCTVKSKETGSLCKFGTARPHAGRGHDAECTECTWRTLHASASAAAGASHWRNGSTLPLFGCAIGRDSCNSQPQRCCPQSATEEKEMTRPQVSEPRQGCMGLQMCPVRRGSVESLQAHCQTRLALLSCLLCSRARAARCPRLHPVLCTHIWQWHCCIGLAGVTTCQCARDDPAAYMSLYQLAIQTVSRVVDVLVVSAIAVQRPPSARHHPLVCAALNYPPSFAK